jgi:hypothetical protein
MENFSNNQFKIFGDFVEDEILKKIQVKCSLAWNVNKEGVRNKKRDIKIPEIKKSVEVKADYVCPATGNLWIEVVGWDGDSGLTTTDSDWWIFVTGFRIIWITPLEIYRFLETHPKSHHGRESKVGKGDSYNKIVYSVNHDDFVNYVYNLDKKNGHVEMIDKNDSLYWFNCLKYNSDLEEKYMEDVKKMMKNLNMK